MLRIQHQPKPIRSPNMTGRLKTYIEFSDDLCVNCFRGQSPRYRAYVVNRPRSVGFAHEPLKILDDLFASQLRVNPRYGGRCP